MKISLNKNRKQQSNISDFPEVSITEIDQKFKSAFARLKQEMTEHLTSINQNTNEIQSNYEFLLELESKINKLSERMDELSMYLGLGGKSKYYEVKSLNRREQEVFLLLYTLKEGGSITYQMIARRLALTESLVQNYVANMIAKGVPVIKRYINNNVHLSLDPHFKALQAKENIAGIHRKLSESHD